MADVGSPLIIAGFLEKIWFDPKIYSVYSYRSIDQDGLYEELSFAVFFSPENDMNQKWMRDVKLLYENGNVTSDGKQFILSNWQVLLVEVEKTDSSVTGRFVRTIYKNNQNEYILQTLTPFTRLNKEMPESEWPLVSSKAFYELVREKIRVRIAVKIESKSTNAKKEEPVIEVNSSPVTSKTSAGEIVIDIDGNVYTTVKIGNQVWTVENLKTTKYNDGTAIPLVADKNEWSSYNDDKKPAYCWYDNDINNKEKYGALYNWYAVNTGKLAPKGWHLPTDAEWTELEEYLIANGYNWDGSKEGNKIAKALAAKTDWNWDSNNDSGTIGNNLSKNNASGFSALPGGYRHGNGYFFSQSSNGSWISTTGSSASDAWGRSLGYSNEYLSRCGDSKGCGSSVRLVRDN